MNLMKKALSVAVSAAMLGTGLPGVVFAQEPAEQEADSTNFNENEQILADENEIDYETVGTQDSERDEFYKIFHLDAGRKYFSKEVILDLLDTIAEQGYTQLELYLSDNQGFRFALDDTALSVNGTTYDLNQDGVFGRSETYTGADGYLNQSDMDEIIAKAQELNVDIVPAINILGHMGRILEVYPQLRYTGSTNTIDITSDDGYQFALALTQKYVDYFRGKNVKYYNICADEFANDRSMGFSYMNQATWSKFVSLVNDAASLIKNAGMTPRMFNDGVMYNSIDRGIDKDIQICYWSSGWNGYNLASATTLRQSGYQLINANGDYYWVLGQTKSKVTPEKAAGFDKYTFIGGSNITDPAGAMFCVWNDEVEDGYDDEDGRSVINTVTQISDDFVSTLSDDIPETDDTDPITGSCSIDLWITNRQVEASSNPVEVDYQSLHSENGVSIFDLVPLTGTFEGNALNLWTGRILPEGNHQTDDPGIDRTQVGDEFQYLRFWDGSLQYSLDQTSWKNIESSNQIVAYYLQVTNVTDEVTTEVVDWGVNFKTYNSRNFIGVDFTVIYENGQETPTSFPNSKTIGYHCELNNYVYRNIGMIRARDNDEYEIYKITVTNSNDSKRYTVGSNARNVSSYTYKGEERIAWAIDAEAKGDMSEYTDINGNSLYLEGGDPIVKKLDVYNRHCAKVTYYLRAKVTEESLTVKFVDNKTGNQFHGYNIAVKKGIVFKENIQLDRNGNVLNGSVVNSTGTTQNVSSDLSGLTTIPPQYRNSKYSCVNLERSEDGKTVTLYYDFFNTMSLAVDFSAPMKVTGTDLGLTDAVITSASKSAHGTVTVEGNAIVYKPNTVMTSTDTVVVEAKTKDGDVISKNIYFHPATTVYYEAEVAAPAKGWELKGSETTEQNTEPFDSETFVYGYDPNAQHNSFDQEMRSYRQSTEVGDNVLINFTGTGIHLFMDVTPDTGSITFRLDRINADGSRKIEKSIKVNTQMNAGVTDITHGNETVTAIGLPVVALDDLQYGTYEVKVTHVKTKAGETSTNPVILDGYKIYSPLENHDIYPTERQNPDFTQVRNHLLSEYAGNWDGSEQVFDQIDGDIGAFVGENNAPVSMDEEKWEDLLINGPKNEVFLYPGQYLIFKPTTSITDNLQIGLNAVNGPTTADVTGEQCTLDTATEMYYLVSPNEDGYVKITNTGENILSITDLKFYGDLTTETNAFDALSGEKVKALALDESDDSEVPEEPDSGDQNNQKKPGLIEKIFDFFKGWFRP